MTPIAARILFIAAVALAAITHAQAADTRRTDELMHLSGLWTQLGQVQAQMRAGAEEAQKQAAEGKGGNKFEDADFARLLASMDNAYAPARLQAAMTRELQELVSAADEREVLKWLSSDLGKRFTKLEEESGEAERAARAAIEAPAYFPSVTKARLAKIERMVKAIRLGEGTASMLINMTTAIGYGMAMANPTEDPARVAQAIRGRIEPQRAQMAAAFDQHALQTFSYMYREISDGDLERYVAFAESPAGNRYHEATIKGMDRVFARAGLDVGREFDLLMRQPARRS